MGSKLYIRVFYRWSSFIQRVLVIFIAAYQIAYRPIAYTCVSYSICLIFYIKWWVKISYISWSTVEQISWFCGVTQSSEFYFWLVNLKSKVLKYSNRIYVRFLLFTLCRCHILSEQRIHSQAVEMWRTKWLWRYVRWNWMS